MAIRSTDSFRLHSTDSLQLSNRQPGVSGFSVYAPQLRVPLDDWCSWTGNDYGKVKSVVGKSFRMTCPDENAYTMAATAVLDLIDKYDVDPRHIGFLGFGTESSTDNSAGAVILRGLVDRALVAMGKPAISVNCEVPEVKHACLGGIYALKQAVRYLATDGFDRKAIVVSADIAEYARGSSGEQTQGAGAVAMLLEADPKLFRVDLRRSGTSSNYRGPDFRKPVARHFMEGYTSAEGTSRPHDFPVFNGKYSTFVYIDSVIRAMEDMFRRQRLTVGRRNFFTECVQALFFHRPYHWMPIQAMAAVWTAALVNDDAPELYEISEQAGVDVGELRREMDQAPSCFDGARVDETVRSDPRPLLSKAARAARKHPAFERIRNERMSLGAERMMNLGNLYTAALPAWLAAGFENAVQRGWDLSGRQILAVGYGSGDASEALVLEVVPGTWIEAARRIGFSEALEGAVDLTRDDYESLHDTGRLPLDFVLPEGKDVHSAFLVERVGDRDEPGFCDMGLEYYRCTERVAAANGHIDPSATDRQAA